MGLESQEAGRIYNLYIPRHPITRTTLFQTNKSQSVRLPKDVAFPPGVREVTILRDGPRRVIVPADTLWDGFFDSPGTDLGERTQPEAQSRDPL